MIENTRAKNKAYGLTSIIAAAICLIAVVAAVICGLNLPFKGVYKEVTPASASSEAGSSAINALVQGYAGEEYFIVADSTIEKRNALNDELIDKKDYSAEITQFAADNELGLKKGSLKGFYFKHVTVSESERYLLAFDNVGNIFKYADTLEGLTLTNDCYVTSDNYEYLESTFEGQTAYLLFKNESSITELRKFDVCKISDGCLSSRCVWNIDKVLDDADGGGYVLTVGGANVKVWDIAVSGDYVYLVFSNGIYKISKDFADCKTDGKSVLFFEQAESQYESNYHSALLSLAEQHEVDFPENATSSDLEKILVEANVGIKNADIRNLKKEVRKNLSDDLPWCEAYDGSSLTIAKEYLDFNCYSVSKYGANAPYGIAYAACSDTFYIASERTLYSLSSSVLGTFDFADESLADYMQECDFVTEGNRAFDNKRCPISYNPYSDCIFITYENIDIVSIADVSESPRILYSFAADYSIEKHLGDANNSSYHYIALSAATQDKYVYSVSPAKSVNGSNVKTLLIISAIVAVVSIIVTAVAFYGYSSERGAEKLKVIKIDLIKNKWVYVAIVPFIVLICMFCYYEAIGAISFSFFEYTRDEPTRNWNNFNNFKKIFNDPQFFTQVKNMLFFLVFDILFAIVPPVLFAFMLSIMVSKKYSKLTRTLLFIPGILPGVASMLVWKIGIYGDYGILNKLFMQLFGLKRPINFLENGDIAVWSLLLMGFPYVGTYLIFYGGMMNIPSSYYEAAELEGCTVMRRLLQIDIPLIVSQLKYVFITTFINSVQNYARTYMLGWKSATPVSSLYEAVTRGDYGLSSAYAVLIFLFLLAAMIINFRSQKKDLEGSL